MSGNDAILELYFGYLPNTPLAVVSTILYFVVSLPLFYQSYHHRNKLTYVLPITGLVECVGYIVRLYMIQNASQGVYVLMALLIILAPNALAFANYKVLGKIIHAKAVHLRLPSAIPAASASFEDRRRYCLRIPYLMNEYGEVHGNRLASFFFISDVAAILLQGSGGGMQGAGDTTLGTDVLLFGLGSQLFFFAVFTALAIYVYMSPIYREPAGGSGGDDKNSISEAEYKRAFLGLFLTIAFLYARNIYRVVEFTMGYRGYLATNEAFMYFFDTLFIFIDFILYIYFNFAAFLSKADAQVQRDLAAAADFHSEAAKPTEGSANERSGNVILVRMADSSADAQPSASVEMV